jgi:hypothetical protein
VKNRAIVTFLFLSFLALAAFAKEGGDQYPNGAENWFAGAAPPPGSYFINYSGYYGGRLKDGSGQNVLLNGGTPLVNATFNAFRFAAITRFKLLGADYGAHLIVPLVYQSVNLNGRSSEAKVGDVIVNPLILGWHHPQWHAIAAVDVFLPTGYYDQNDARVSIGANYYGFDPLFAVSYMPKSGWEASGKFMYNIKTTNRATNYHSGQEFHADYAAGRHIGGWMAGATGYALRQVTNDTAGGTIEAASTGMWDAGRKGQVLAIGPSLGYSNRNHITLMADWQHETLVRNRFGGDKFWIKMIVPVDGGRLLRAFR